MVELLAENNQTQEVPMIPAKPEVDPDFQMFENEDYNYNNKAKKKQRKRVVKGNKRK